MTIHEILLIGLPILVGVFGLGLYWILERDLNRPITFDSPVPKSEEKLTDGIKMFKSPKSIWARRPRRLTDSGTRESCEVILASSTF